MVRCCVPGCGASGSKIFHAFPANREIRRLWIKNTKTFHLTEDQLGKYAKVCRYHFRETDFIINRRGQQGLKANTVPSLRLPEVITSETEHKYPSGGEVKKQQWRHRYPTASSTDFEFEVQNVEVNNDGFNADMESNRIKENERIVNEYELNMKIYKRKISELTAEVRISNKKLRISDQKLGISNEKLKNVRQQLKQEKLNKNNVFNYSRSIFNEEQLAFFSKQLRNSGRKSHGRRFTSEEKSLSLILYKHSPKNYRFMRKRFILPSKRTVGRHSAQLTIGTGVNTKLFAHVKEKVNSLTENGKYCLLSWDEVSLKSHLDYSTSRDEIDGFVDLATIRRPSFATHSLTFMIRGIYIPFKQAIGYFFTDGLKAFELVEIIKLMTEAVLDTGLKVVLSTCDQARTNVKAVHQLIDPNCANNKKAKISTGGLLSYKIRGTKIIHCYDPSHLIKGIRNNLIKNYLKHNITKR